MAEWTKGIPVEMGYYWSRFDWRDGYPTLVKVDVGQMVFEAGCAGDLHSEYVKNEFLAIPYPPDEERHG